ncbi:WYL domain-containing protein [Streptomyces sp. RS10V-4]|uniref:helix-turn-helix transcriptional regulator n=1 Tax=Streptomyces rhizoryzae TaxID=2932493 RepID=UPI002003C3E3|nr:WYL domain-containing protein [Streptomyces rhizoryzae]MCK7624414.1 WYL domain-containing protein [Streptomyces rhizoryzae]
MSRPTGRVLTLLELLQSGGTRTVAELSDRLGVDGRTVRRYVEQLVDLEVPVESVRGRYGGYRLGAGYRLPPLMLSDDEALAVLLGLVAGRRAGLATAERTASETAAAKIRRVLPRHLTRRLDTLLESLAFTDRPGGSAPPDAGVLLTLADAVRHRRPVSLRYTDRDGRPSERTLHAYGIVSHAGRWYVTGRDARIGEDRTFRLDRIADARTLPGAFAPPEDDTDPAERVLSGFATAAYRHRVTLRIQAAVDHIRDRLPAAVAILDDGAEGPGREQAHARVHDHEHGEGDERAAAEAPAAERWLRVELRVERLDWLPAVLASLDRPFVIERPDELRGLVLAHADRLADCARARA